MDDYQVQLKQYLQKLINCIKETLQVLKAGNFLGSSSLNHVNAIAFNPEVRSILNSLTENLENILRNALLLLNKEKSKKCSNYLLNILHKYHYNRNGSKFKKRLVINNIHTLLNNLNTAGAALDAFPAAWKGKINLVRKFIEHYPQFKDKPGIWGTTLLYSAARNNHFELVKYLISDAHCSVNAQNEQHIEKVLTSKPKPVNAPDFVDVPIAGSTALHGACYNGHLEIVKYLIEHGADYYLTNHSDETPIANAKQSKIIVEYFQKFLILGYSIKTDCLPEKPIIEGGQDLINDCVWEYKPFADPIWYEFSTPESEKLSRSLRIPPNEEFQKEIHLKAQRGLYGVSTVKFLRSGRNLNNDKNLAWVRCRGSSILNFDAYSIWQLMIIQHPSINPKSIPSLEPFNIPLLDSRFKFKANTWYNCPLKINSQLDKAINYRQKIISLKFPFIEDPLQFNLQSFRFYNHNETISGYIRWIPKIISIDKHTKKISDLDNFKPMVDVKPIVMTSKHQKYLMNKDDKSLTEDGEYDMMDGVNEDAFNSSTDDESDNDDDRKQVN